MHESAGRSVAQTCIFEQFSAIREPVQNRLFVLGCVPSASKASAKPKPKSLEELRAEVSMWQGIIARLQTEKSALEKEQVSRYNMDGETSAVSARWSGVQSLHDARETLKVVFSSAACARLELHDKVRRATRGGPQKEPVPSRRQGLRVGGGSRVFDAS